MAATDSTREAAGLRVQIYAATADAALADRVAAALAGAGVVIVNGRFEPAACEAVIVIWSEAALRSRSLIEAARAPMEAGVLLPVSFGRTAPPDGFHDIQPASLVGWDGGQSDPRWRFVLDELSRLAGSTRPAPASVKRSTAPPLLPPEAAPFGLLDTPRPTAAQMIGFALIAAAIVGVFAAVIAPRGRAPQAPEAPIVAHISPAADMPAASPPPAPLAAARPVAEPEPAASPAPEDDAAVAEAAPSDDASLTPPPTEQEAVEDDSFPAFDRIAALIEEHVAIEGEGDMDTAAVGHVAVAAAMPAAPGEQFRDCDACPKMSVVPAGAFMMGAPSGEGSRQPAEGPVREVTIAQPFAIGVHEVTFDEWEACLADEGCGGHLPPDYGWGRGRQPVIGVSASDAEAYAAWLSEKTGRRYRLPSEAEWEYAARAGAQTPFSFGEQLTPEQANFNGSHPYGAPPGVNRARPLAVGRFEANAYGLYDMHGNVWEWTADCWADSHDDAPADGSARGGDCARHVLKGGAWNSGGWRLRAGHRLAKTRDARAYDYGFRVVRELD